MDSENPGRLIIIDYQRPNYHGASVGDERRERVQPGTDGVLIKLTVPPPPGTEAFLPLLGEDGRWKIARLAHCIRETPQTTALHGWHARKHSRGSSFGSDVEARGASSVVGGACESILLG